MAPQGSSSCPSVAARAGGDGREENPAKSRCEPSNRAQGHPWLRFEVRAGTLAKARLPPSRRGTSKLKAHRDHHWERARGA